MDYLRILFVSACCCTALITSGCGVKGELVRPSDIPVESTNDKGQV